MVSVQLTNLGAELSKLSFFVVAHERLSFEMKVQVDEDEVVWRQHDATGAQQQVPVFHHSAVVF